MLQRSFILHPKKLDKSHEFDFNFNYEEKTFPIEEGSIHAIHAKTSEISKGVVLYFHGNADNLDRWGQNCEDFTNRGYDVIMMDYRGFGKSDGRSTEETMYEDAKTIYNYAINQYDQENIIIYGRSIGSGVATHLAETRAANQLMLETPFYSLQDVVKEKYPFILLVVKLKFEFPNFKNIEKLETPIHIFHGTKDRIVPYISADKLRPFLKENDSFLTVDGAGHKDIPTYEVYQSRLDSLLY